MRGITKGEKENGSQHSARREGIRNNTNHYSREQTANGYETLSRFARTRVPAEVAAGARRSRSSGAPPLFFHSQIPAVRVCWPRHAVVLNLWETSGIAAALTWTAGAGSGGCGRQRVIPDCNHGDPYPPHLPRTPAD